MTLSFLPVPLPRESASQRLGAEEAVCASSHVVARRPRLVAGHRRHRSVSVSSACQGTSCLTAAPDVLAVSLAAGLALRTRTAHPQDGAVVREPAGPGGAEMQGASASHMSCPWHHRRSGLLLWRDLPAHGRRAAVGAQGTVARALVSEAGWLRLPSGAWKLSLESPSPHRGQPAAKSPSLPAHPRQAGRVPAPGPPSYCGSAELPVLGGGPVQAQRSLASLQGPLVAGGLQGLDAET